MANMADYLSVKVADYTVTELTLAPHKVLHEEGDIEQEVLEYDHGDVEIITLSESFFNITLQWDYLVLADAYALQKFWYEYADCFGQSFYWHHPYSEDSNIYVARFQSVPVFTFVSQFVNAQKIPPVKLGIEGVKA